MRVVLPRARRTSAEMAEIESIWIAYLVYPFHIAYQAYVRTAKYAWEIGASVSGLVLLLIVTTLLLRRMGAAWVLGAAARFIGRHVVAALALLVGVWCLFTMVLGYVTTPIDQWGASGAGVFSIVIMFVGSLLWLLVGVRLLMAGVLTLGRAYGLVAGPARSART